MSRINIDVKKAEDFNNNLRAFKRYRQHEV